MKIKRILAVVLTIVMLLGMAPIGAINLATKASAKDISSYSVGDTIEFGSYPQSKVTDSTTLTALDSISKSWISYGYYSGTGSRDDGNMNPSDYMKYCDISYNGNEYRAVTFSSYRPYYTGYTSSTSKTYQDDNGYYTGNVYYFKYEPLKWRVLDPSEGFVMCTTAIDAQAYNNYVLFYDNGNSTSYDDYYGDSAKTYYASDWANSSIRAWLNDNFYKTAFTSSEKTQIGTTYNENKSIYSSEYDSANTSDKIFLLSFNESRNSSYGLNNTARQLKSTDYAKCQGCRPKTYTTDPGNPWWRLRSPDYSYIAAGVGYTGGSYSSGYVDITGGGIVPAFKFNPNSTIGCDTHNYESTITLQPTCTINGERKYTCSVCGDSYTETIPALGHEMGEWVVMTEPTASTDGVIRRTCNRCDYYEENVMVSGIEISSNKEILMIGNTITLTAEIIPGTASNKTITWTSLDTNIATVVDGVVTANCAGSTVIIAETVDGGYKDFCKVRVPGITPLLNSTAVVDYDNGIICGFAPNLITLDSYIEPTENDLTLDYSTETIGTGTIVNVIRNGEVIDSYTTVLFGDVNNDGIYDGTDSIIVNCLANGLLSRAQVGEAVYMAADCNHDGDIDQLDVDILQQAGVLLSQVDQSKSEEELFETNSVYVEYLNLIKQTVETETTDTDKNEPTMPEIEPARPEPLIFRIVNAIALVFWSVVNFFTNLFD